MANKDYEDMTVAELKDLCEERSIHGVSGCTKDELISELEDADKENSKGKTTTSSTGKGETRMFQTGPDPTVKTAMTKAEAEKAGHYWSDTAA